MSSPPFMPLYIADYIADTVGLTTEQHGAYLLLLMASWKMGGRLPNDPKHLARFTYSHPSRWARIAPQVLKFFQLDDSNCWFSPRLVEEYEKASGKNLQRARVGSRGGQATALKRQKVTPANAAPYSDIQNSDTSSLRSEDASAPAREDDEDLFGLADLAAPASKTLDVLGRLDRGEASAPSPAIEGEVSAQTPGLSELARRIFGAMGSAAQAKLKRGDKDVFYALRQAHREGLDVQKIASECQCYYQHPDQREADGRFAKGAFALIRDGYWAHWRGEAYTEAQPARRPVMESADGPLIVIFRDVGYAVPEGRSFDVESLDPADPGVHIQVVWLDDWFGYPAADRFRHWSRSKRGPMPGEPGCRIWPSVFDKHPGAIREREREGGAVLEQVDR